MRKQYKRVLASAMAAILIWNTCGWQVPALAASVVYQVEEIEQLPEEVLYQEVPYGTKYKDLELPDKLKMLVLTEDEETWDEEADDGGAGSADIATPSQLRRMVDEAETDEPIRKASQSDADETIKTATSSDADDIYSGEDWKDVKIRWVLCENRSEKETYDGKTPGIYVFDAELKNDRYELVNDFLPRIEVTVLPEEKGAEITEFLPLDENIAVQNLPLGANENNIFLPETLNVRTEKQNESGEDDEAPYQITGVAWKLDGEQSDFPEFHGGISEKDYFDRFDESGEPVETSMKTWAGYAEENKEYNGRAYVYTPVLPESAEKFEIAEIELPEIYVLVGDAGLATMALGETYNLNENYLVINSTNVSRYDEITITGTYNPQTRISDYTRIKGGIMIDDVTVNLTIENVNIGYNNSGWDLAGIYLGGNAKLNLTIKGKNTLAGADMGAGIEVGEKATLVISRDSTGTLTATGGGYGAAGIGGRGAFISSEGGGTKNEAYKTGTIEIWGGTIQAKGGRYQIYSDCLGGAGIGTGVHGCGGKIRILGGNIEATSGMTDGAGIGGGSNGMVNLIRIGGADTEVLTVTASAYNTQLGAAIGTGLNSTGGLKLSCGTIEILSGDVTASGNIGYGALHVYNGNMFFGGNVEISDEVNLKLTEGTITPRGNCTFGKKTFQITAYDNQLENGEYAAKVKLYKEKDTEKLTPVFEKNTTMTVSAFRGTIPDITEWIGSFGNMQVVVELTASEAGTSQKVGTALVHKGKDETVNITLGENAYKKTMNLTVYDGRLEDGKNYTLSVQVGEISESGMQPDRVTYSAKAAANHQIKAGKISWYSSLTGDQPVLITIQEEESKNTYTVSGTLSLNAETEANLTLSVWEPLYPVRFLFYSPQVQDTDKVTLKAKRADTSGSGTQTELNREQGQFAFDGKLVKDAADENYAVATAYFPAGEYEFDIETGITELGDSKGSFQLKQQTVKADMSGTDIRALNDMQTLSGELDLSQGDITFTEEAGNLVVSYYQKGNGSETAVLKTVRGQSYDTWYTIVTSQNDTDHSLVLTDTSANKDVNLVLKNVNIKATGNTAPIQINGNSRAAVYLEGSNSVLIQKGDNGDSPAGISVSKDAKITIDSKAGQDGSIEIVNRSTGDSDAAIGGSKNQDTGTVIINGGSVTAKLENINRNYGSSAAAIGSSAGKSVKLIQINGGTVTAATNGRGAGIGTAVASSNDRNGTIVINGGTIEATSYQGAGIGSGVGVSKQVAVEERTKTNIEIHGGSIIAGSSSGASIGSGNEGAANVMIDGGTIGLKGTKSLPSQCADIGKGQSNSSYAITSVMVKGGSIYMTDDRRTPVLAGWKQNENQGWERELPTDGKDSAVYYTTADLFTVYGAKVKVENASLQDISYGFEDVYTNSQGKIGIYLPAAASVKATFDGIHYNGKVEAGSNSNVLERDLTTINYKEELLNNSSQTVVEFAQSKAASEWTSIPAGGAVSLTDILNAQPDKAAEFSLYVRKQGSGEATEIKIPARPGKPKQVDDVMRSYDYITVQNYGTAYEYGITDRESEGSTVRWQDSSCFDGLQAAHTYGLVVRIKATESQFASKPSDIKTVTTQDVLRIAGSGNKEFITSGTYGQPLSQVTVRMADGYQVVNAHDQQVSGTWNWSETQSEGLSKEIYPEVNGKSYRVQFTPDHNPAGLYGYSLGKSVNPDISPKKLTAVLSSSIEKTYDNSSEIQVNATVDTGMPGQTLTISGLKGRFEDANVGTDKKVTIDPSEVKVAAGERSTKPENYQITFPAETTGTILPAQGTVTIDSKEWPGQKTYGDARFLLTGVAESGDGNLIYTSSDESVLTVDEQGMVTIKGAGSAEIRVSMANGTNYIGTSAPATGTILVEKGTITFTLTAVNRNSQTQTPQTALGTHEDSYDIIASAEGVYDDRLNGMVTFYDHGEPFAKAQLTDGKAVTHWVNPGELSPTAVGQHTMTAEYELTNTESINYQKPDPAAFSFEIGKADENEVQIVAVNGKVYGDAPFDLEVSGQKGTGAVIYSVPEDNGVLELPDNHGSGVKIIGAGTVMVTAAIAGDEKYNGTTVTRKITIGKAAAPQIIWPTASSVEAGSSLSAAVLTGGSTEYGSFTWKDPALLAEAGTRSYEVVFTPNEWTAKNYEIRPMIGVVELTAAVPAPDNRDHNTADRDSSSDRDASSAAIRKDQIKGRISSDRGIMTGAANSTANDGYSHWMQDEHGWWLRFADNSYPKGKKHGTSGIAYAWELINGNWWAFDENGYAKTGWLRDETFGGWFYIDPKRGMQIGWVLIDGVWYYFHPVSDGRKGIMYAGQKTPDGYYVDENGAWDGKEK